MAHNSRNVHRILHLVHWMNRGGIETWIMNILRAVDHGRYQMDICCKGPSTGILADEAELLGAKVLHCEFRPTHLGFKYRLSRLLREGRYDTLHIHTGVYSGYPASIAKSCGLNVIVTYHNTNFISQAWKPWFLLRVLRQKYTHWSIGLAGRKSDCITCCSRAVLAEARNHYDVGDPDKIHIWYCGVPVPPVIASSTREKLRHNLRLGDGVPVVIHVGSFREQKNHEGFIRIAEMATRIRPDIKFLLVGDGPLRLQVESMIKQAGLQENIRLLGLRSDVQELLSIADIFLFPSKWEGLPVTVIEAQMSGLPVIGTDIPSIREGVVPGETALLFDLEDEETMAIETIKLIEDGDRREAMSQAGLSYALKHFTMEASLDRLYEFYDLLSRRA